MSDPQININKINPVPPLAPAKSKWPMVLLVILVLAVAFFIYNRQKQSASAPVAQQQNTPAISTPVVKPEVIQKPEAPTASVDLAANKLPDAFPKDFPSFPKDTLDKNVSYTYPSGIGSKQVICTPRSIPVTFDAYKNYLTAAGWKVTVLTKSTPDNMQLYAVKGTDTASIAVHTWPDCGAGQVVADIYFFSDQAK